MAVSTDNETERYKQAANDTLQLLDWCIGYLLGIRKKPIAATVAQNRSYIREQLMKEAPEPLPTEEAPAGVGDGGDDRDEDWAARYKQATNDALQQLDFCIGFFAGANKAKAATQLAQNRAYIRERLLGEAAQPVPTSDA